MLPDDHDPDDCFPMIIIERESPRRPLEAAARVVSPIKGKVGGRLIDISEGGCKIALFDASVRPGHKITIKLQNLELWVGYVRWTRGAVAGVNFERPMHSAIVDHLSQSSPRFEFS